MDARDASGKRVEVNPLDAEKVLKELMTKVWIAGGGRLEVSVCVDEAMRMAKERFGLEVPLEWRERFIRAASQALEAREAPAQDLPVEVEKTTQEEFESKLAKAPSGLLKVKTFKGEKP